MPSATRGDSVGVIIQSPGLDNQGRPTRRSISDATMAANVVKTIISSSRNRQIINSRILAKYNAERPYDAYKLEAEGLGWRSNFTTKPLPTMIEKVAPRFVSAIDGLKYFTNARLPNRYQNATQKSEKFRDAITRTIRARKGWRTLIEDIAFYNSLFGHTIVAWLDAYTWFPKHFKYEESFLPDGTKDDVRWAQVIVLKEVYLPHELFAQIEDKEAAKDAGFNIINTIEAINNASPSQIRDRLNVGGTLEAWYQNAIRELTIGASYMAGASVVTVYSLLAREVTGKVSHYRLAGEGLKPIMEREDAYDSMGDAAAFYSFQKGIGTMHGSKGVARDIYEMAGMLDRTRNEIVDRTIMSGKTLVQGDIKRIHTFKMNVVGSTVIIPNGWAVLEQKIDGNVEPFIKLDGYFKQLINELVGSTSTPNPDVGEGMRSSAAWALLAQREEEGKDVKLTRFLEQFVTMIGTMQKRLCDPDTIEQDAKDMQKDLLDVMTREELDILAQQPASGTVKDLTPFERQLIIATCTEKRGNPAYNQHQLEVEDITARAGADFAERVLLPVQDPTEQAEQMRQQDLELVLLGQGHPVPVSPRDNHLIHLSVLMPSAEQAAGQMAQGEFATGTMEAILAHITEHYNQAVQQGVKKEQLKEVADFVAKAGPTVAQLKAVDLQEQELALQHQAATLDPNAPVPAVPPAEVQAPLP